MRESPFHSEQCHFWAGYPGKNIKDITRFLNTKEQASKSVSCVLCGLRFSSSLWFLPLFFTEFLLRLLSGIDCYWLCKPDNIYHPQVFSVHNVYDSNRRQGKTVGVHNIYQSNGYLRLILVYKFHEQPFSVLLKMHSILF